MGNPFFEFFYDWKGIFHNVPFNDQNMRPFDFPAFKQSEEKSFQKEPEWCKPDSSNRGANGQNKKGPVPRVQRDTVATQEPSNRIEEQRDGW